MFFVVLQFKAVKTYKNDRMNRLFIFLRARKYFFYGMLLVLFFGTAFAAVQDVTSINDKVAGDSLKISDFNKIVNTVKSFYRDDVTGDVGIGTATPAEKLDVTGNAKISGTLEWGGGASISSSDTVETFPYDQLVTSYWDSTVQAFRLMVDATNGDDANDGLTWATAKATIQGALDALPLNLKGYEAQILVHSGTYGEISIMNNNGTLRLIWMGTFVNTSEHASAVWYRNGSTNPIRDDNPINVVTSSSSAALTTWQDNLYLSLDAYDARYVHYATGHSYWGRWRFTTDGVATPDNLMGVYNKSFYADNVYFDLKGTRYSAVNIEPKNGGTSAILSMEVVGGTAESSTACNLWRAVIGSRTTTGNVIIGRENTAAQGWATGFAPPHGAWFDMTGVRCMYSTWGNENKNLIFHPRTIYYAQGSLPDANTPQIYLEPAFSGYVAYNPTYSRVWDNSTSSHSIYNYGTAVETRYVSSGIVDKAGNIGIGTIAPTGKLSVTPTQYSTGTASQSATTVTGVGTTFTSSMVGSQFVFADGTNAGTITAYNSATSLTVSTSQTVATQAYKIAYTGLQVGSTGNVGIGTTSPAYKLDISGDSRVSGDLYVNGSDVLLNQNGSGYATFGLQGTASGLYDWSKFKKRWSKTSGC
ncbi:hypothetical protein K9L27_04425 [Candidatus Gracilibacteria bacterium]|nr:hypothetical protein [Candidatus Gracilibacteria bacterium]